MANYIGMYLLQAIKEHIDAVEANVAKLEERQDKVMQAADEEGRSNLSALMDTLKTHLKELNEAYEKRLK